MATAHVTYTVIKVLTLKTLIFLILLETAENPVALELVLHYCISLHMKIYLITNYIGGFILGH